MPFIELDQDIVRWSREFDSLSNEYRVICQEAQETRDAYDLAKAHAMLDAPQDYRVDEKKAHVTRVCHPIAVKAHAAEASQEWYKERLRSLAGLLNAAQSRAAMERAEMNLTMTGGKNAAY